MKYLKKYIFEIVLFLIILFLYLFSLYPQVSNGDSGELLSASYTLGIAHPPGYPIYLILLKLFIFILPFNPAFSGNIMSAFFSACSMLLLYANIKLIFTIYNNTIKSIYEKLNILILIITFSITPILLSQSIITEVYTLNLFFILLLNFLFLKYYISNNFKLLCLFSFISGISLTHHPTIILTLPIYLFLIFIKNKRKLNNLIKPFLFFILGIIPFFYLIIRANTDPLVNWGDPSNIKRFFAHVFRVEYKNQDLVKNRDIVYFLRQLYMYIKILFEQFFIFIAAGLSGMLLMFKTNKKASKIILLFLFMLTFVFVIILNTKLNLHIIFTSKVFYLPSFALIFILIAYSLHVIVKKHKYFFILPLIILVFSIINNYIPQNQNYIAYDFSKNILKTTTYNSALFTVEGDNPLFALAYHRYVEYKRPDLDYCNRYGKLFISSQEYFKNLLSINSKDLFFVSPERIDPNYAKYIKSSGIIYKLIQGDTKNYFLNWYDLRSSSTVLDYMDKGLASIYYWRLAYYYKDNINNIKKYNNYISLCTEYSDELIDIQRMLGRLYYSKKNYKKAEVYFNNMIKIDPDNRQAYFFFGMCQLKQKKFKIALKYLLQAYNRGVKSLELYKAIAFTYYKLGSVYECILYIEEALSIYKNNVSLKQTLEYYQNIIK